MKKPTVEQVAWVFKHLADGIKEPGTFRYLIYDRMGFGPEAYNPLYSAGGMLITNTIWEQQEKRESNELSTPAATTEGRMRTHHCGTEYMEGLMCPTCFGPKSGPGKCYGE